MSKFSLLNTVNNYSVQEFIEFLRDNGLSEFENIVTKKSIDGHTFLHLAEFEINNWKPHINATQAQKFWTFLNQFQHYPENFVYLGNNSTTPPMSSISKDHLQKLSQNESFLHSLRTAVQNRIANRHRTGEEEEVPLVQNHDGRDRKVPLPPRPPIYKRSVVPTTKYVNSDSDDQSDTEVLYETPDDQAETNILTKEFGQKISKALPELPPVTFAKHTGPYESNATLQISTEEKAPLRKPFRLEQHYNRQREQERETVNAPQNIAKLQIQNSPLPPIPSVTIKREISPQTRKTVTKTSTLPRPPPLLPNVPKLTDPFDVGKQKPMEQEGYYRYTDRKGAEDLLSEEFGDGTYLIRPSRNYHSTLSVRQGDKIYHIGIKKVDGNKLEMESSGLNLKFNALNEIIEYFRTNPLSVRNKYNEIVDIYLIRTLPSDRT